MKDLLEMGKLSLSQQPFSFFMQTEFESAEKGNVVLSLKIKEEYKQNFGAIHGGVIGYMADIGLAYAAASEVGDCVTSELKINYIRPGTGTKIIVRAHSISVSSRQVVSESKVFSLDETKENPEEVLVAVALGTINRVIDTKRG
ncbi:MAG: PaaI family thioesterase [Gammaproteobacteria bacterium]|nr:MAG: PaaI family thioesterase [Gammaproteobacteria bacterium]